MKSNHEAAERADADLASNYNRALSRIANISKNVEDVNLNRLKVEWEEEQKRIMDAGNAALALCET